MSERPEASPLRRRPPVANYRRANRRGGTAVPGAAAQGPRHAAARSRLFKLCSVGRAEPVGFGGGEGNLCAAPSSADLEELFGDAGELVHRSYHLDPVADLFVEGHVATSQSPAPPGLGCDPDSLPGVLRYLLQRLRVGMLPVIASVAQDHDCRAVVYSRQIPVLELLGGLPKSCSRRRRGCARRRFRSRPGSWNAPPRAA